MSGQTVARRPEVHVRAARSTTSDRSAMSSAQQWSGDSRAADERGLAGARSALSSYSSVHPERSRDRALRHRSDRTPQHVTDLPRDLQILTRSDDECADVGAISGDLEITVGLRVADPVDREPEERESRCGPRADLGRVLAHSAGKNERIQATE